MNRKPEKSRTGLFANGLWSKIITEGVMIGILTLLSFSIGNKLYGLQVGRTMAFVSLSLLELVHGFNIKSEESIFKAGIFDNSYLLISFIVGTTLQIIVVSIKPISNVFECTPLSSVQWLVVIGISACCIIIMEMQKKINEFKFGKRIYSFER